MFDTGLTPERWLARYGHTLLASYCFEHTYQDPELDAWVQRLAELVFRSRDYPSLDHFRRKHLTWPERQQVRSEIRELEEQGS